MSDFENKVLKLIEESQSALFEIERVLFTRRYNLSQKHFNIFAVQSITMMYSIWEGFIQKVFQLYISEVNSLNLNFNEFSNEIVIFHMENTFKQLKSYPEKNSNKYNFYSNLETFYSKQKHQLFLQINTESNVSFEVLNKLLKTFCLHPFEEHWKNYKHPNPSLKELLFSFLRYRNGIAHGGDISSEDKITQKIYEKYKNLVKDLMYEILNKMLFGLTYKTYLKINN